MLIRRLYDEKLAQASWLVGCGATGEALVIDPNRDAGQYLEAAARERLEVRHVTETHIHADFVSGARELARRTGARTYLSAAGGPEWQYGYAAEVNAVPLADGSEFRVGRVRIQVLHTPGHTPEHVCFLVTDTAGADQPMGVFTGDFVFVGDVGRPDLLERAAGQEGTMEASARTLFRSLQRFRSLPDWLQLWPGHGAGSACGKALGAVPQSTLGYERLFNWGLATEDEAEFVAAVLAGQPDPPAYFALMKRLNRAGPPLLEGFPEPPRLADSQLAALAAGGEVLVDLRSWPEFRQQYVPGSLNIPLNRSFTTYAGSLLDYRRDCYLLVPEGGAAALAEAVRDLAMIGFDRVSGWFGASALAAVAAAGLPLGNIAEVSAAEGRALVERADVVPLDVRGQDEWQGGRVAAPGVRHLPLGELPARAAELPRDRPVLVYCKSGSRSAIAASVLAAQGIRAVNLQGGLDAWQAAGAPAASEAGAAAGA